MLAFEHFLISKEESPQTMAVENLRKPFGELKLNYR